MHQKFNYIEGLELLDLSHYNISNVFDMNCMFNSYKKLKEIKGINRFNTNIVTRMDSMINIFNELEYLLNKFRN